MIQKARYHWPWAVGTGVVCTVGGGGKGWGLGMKGRGVAYFLPPPKNANNFKILKFQIKNKTNKGCFLSRMVNKFRIFIKNLRNTYGLHFTNS
jgi:hypothetical protein